MLTSEEKEILTAIREQMDDEQKEAFDALSDAEKKEVLEEAKTQLNSMSEEEKQAAMQGGHASGGGPLSRIRQLQNMPFGDFMSEFGGKDFFGALLVWPLLKMTRTKKGCLTLLIIITVAIMAFSIWVNS